MTYTIHFDQHDAPPADHLIRALDAAAIAMGTRRTAERASYEFEAADLTHAMAIGHDILDARDPALVFVVGARKGGSSLAAPGGTGTVEMTRRTWPS